MTDKRRIIVNTLVNGAAQVAGVVIGLVMMPLLIRSFGVRDYGVYIIASSIGAYAAILDLGVGAALVKMTADRAARARREQIAVLYATALLFYAGVGVAVATALAVVSARAGGIFHVPADAGGLLRKLLLVTAATALLTWPLSAATYVLHGFQRYALTARTSALALLANAGVAVLVVAFGAGPLVLVVGQSIVLVLSGVTNTVLARRAIGARVSLRFASVAAFREIAGFSWVVFVLQVCTLVIYEQTDRLIVGVFVSAAAVTLYEAAGKFQQLVVQITALSNSAVVPAASHLVSSGQDDALQVLFLRGTKYALALVLPVVVALMVLADPIIRTWLGPEFASQALAAQLFLTHQLLTPGTAVGDNMVLGLGRVRARLPFVIGLLTVGNLVLSLLLVRRLGILGVVLGTVIPHLIDFPFHAAFLLRELRVPLRVAVQRIVLPIYPALAVPAAVAALLRATPLADRVAGLVVAAGASVIAYWLTLAKFGLDELERSELRASSRALREWLRAAWSS